MVSLIIPVYNKKELTERCLASALKNSRHVKEVFVIDNASSDQTPSLLHDLKEKFEARHISFTVITNEKNVGFGCACNQGVRLASGDYITILNNDTWLMPAWDAALMDASIQKNLDLVGPFIDERPWIDEMEERAAIFLEENGVKFRKHFVPILMFFKKTAIEALKLSHGGIFDERFFVTYEDTDLFCRLKELHLTYAQTSLCYVWHHSMGTRSIPGMLPEGYEAEGLRKFVEKWGFDPRKADHTFLQKLFRKYRKSRSRKGLF